ncbi:P27 family phage terminase small subunit [Rhizorhabdus sp.]|uniref:P27 family phage terminase small subunit n=1 Tax=Rhizorhabdus sp. TaxID=1968843 RepID=UPI001984A357|nr:P27 family phage terminase small subunit [Rhizorhabdus sp.]MBD3762455.1 P27 family phage terminase small subunit [Rhizorhabdus sp.]
MNVIHGTGQIVEEPAWALLLDDELEIAAAKTHWRQITTELRDRELLAPANGHAIQRLVVSYIVYDRCVRMVASSGAVLLPKRGNPKAIARTSPWFSAMREAASDAAVLEQEFGISPRRRGAVTKVQRRATRSTGADAFLSAKKG